MDMTSVAVLGSTGSIGTQTLDIVAARPDRYEVAAIGAARSIDLLVEQAQRCLVLAAEIGGAGFAIYYECVVGTSTAIAGRSYWTTVQ